MRPLSLIVSGPLILVLGGLVYQAARGAIQWLVRRDPAYGWASAWWLLGVTFVSSRLVQRVFYASDAAVRVSVCVQIASAVCLLPLSALAARAIAGQPPSKRALTRLLAATLTLTTVLVALASGHEITYRVDLLGEPLRALRIGPWSLLLTPLVVWTGVDAAHALRRAPGSEGGGELILAAVCVAFAALGVNDALLAAGVIRTLQASHFGLFFVMAATGYVFEKRAEDRQRKADEAVQQHTREVETALEEVRAGEARFKLLAAATLEGVIVHEAGEIRDVNVATTRLLGADSQSIRSRPVASCFEEPLAVRALLEGRERGPMEARIKRDDGSTLPVEVTASRGASSAVGILSIRDLTERDALQRRLAFADRMASLGTLAAGAAHEINNPLAYVALNLDYLSEQLQGGALSKLEPDGAREVKTLIDEARSGCARIGKVVQELRTLSREDDKASPSPIDLSAVALAAVKMAQHEIRLRSRMVEHYGDGVIVVATEARLLQVCLNLVINAVQAIPEGHAESHRIVVTTRREGSTAVLEVKDSGVGIAKDLLPRIFDPFFTTKPVGTGTGLGLSICHSIVESLGGRIVVESELGSGSTFRVVFPLATAIATPVPQSPARSQGPSPTGGRILIVDDELVLARALARALRGSEVVIATSGAKAIGELLKADFDVVLCDLTMPDTGGMEVFEHVKKHKPQLAARFILMTGGTLNENAKNILGVHASRTLLKPIDVEVLRRKVNEVLGKT